MQEQGQDLHHLLFGAQGRFDVAIIMLGIFMQNAHAAAQGHTDEESQAAIEEHIKQQLSASPAPHNNGAGHNLLPLANLGSAPGQSEAKPKVCHPPRPPKSRHQCLP